MNILVSTLFVLCTAAPLLTGCDTMTIDDGPSGKADTTDTAEQPSFEEIENFAVYFAEQPLDTLATFDLAILDPDDFPPEAVQRLLRKGTLPVAYINLGEAEAYRWFYDQVDEDWILGANPDWDEHYYVDARAEGWQNLLLEEVIPRIVEKGYRGLFFDMVDTALPTLFPETRPGMVRLIERIRQRYPDLYLVPNNGIFLIEEISSLIDDMVVEDIFTSYDFDTGEYVRTDAATRDARIERLKQLQEAYGLKVLSINYAPPGDRELRQYARQEARKHDFLSFVSTIWLDSIGEAP